MKIVIVGGGKVGYAIAAELTMEGHDITVVDKDRRLQTASATISTV